MSSTVVRTKFQTFLNSEYAYPDYKFMDVDGVHEDLIQALSNNKNFVTEADEPITQLQDWNALQYSSDPEIPVSLMANNSVGTYRESGFISIHVVSKAAIGVNRSILLRCKEFEDKFRGRNIDGIRITGIIPGNFAGGATIDFSGGGYVSATVTLLYEHDRSL